MGLEVAEYLTVDDTGARHQGQNGYTTQLGTEHFAWFESTQTKDRINFLSLLQGGAPSYVLNAQALQYMQEQKLPKGLWEQLKNSTTRVFEGAEQWQAHLRALNFTTQRPIRIATEGALLGALCQRGIPQTLAIISDDAGQFDVLTHGLCWVHAERLIHKLIPLNEQHREDQQAIRAQVWDFYADLKKYQQAPSAEKKAELDRRFDEIFTTKTRFETLNQVLKRLHRNKAELGVWGAMEPGTQLSLKPRHLKLSPHTLRHTHGYHIIQAGGYLGDVAEGLESRLDQVFGGICQAGSGRKRGAT